MVASRRSTPSTPLSKFGASGDEALPRSGQQTSWEYQGVPQNPWARVDDPDVPAGEIIAKLVSESDAVDRMESLVLDYFTASMAELVFLAAKKLTGGSGVHLNHKIARDLTIRVLTEIVEHESEWRNQIRRARRKARQEARRRERNRERDDEAERKIKNAGL